MAHTGFSTSTGIGGGERDYNPTSTDRDNQPAGGAGYIGGGIGDRTQGSGEFGGDEMQDVSTGDQYGSSGGYLPSKEQMPSDDTVKTKQDETEPRRGIDAGETI